MDTPPAAAPHDLRPLLTLLDDHPGALRLLARPQRLVLEGQAEAAGEAAAWSAAQHAAAWDLLEQPQRGALADGTPYVARRAGDAVLLQQAPRPLQEDGERQVAQMSSPLCQRLLGACLELGGNVLVLGPFAPARRLQHALVDAGRCPALLGDLSDVAPPHWSHCGDLDTLAGLPADRIAAWSLPPGRLAQAMQRCCGLVGWLDARRLDRGLMRFELGASGGATGPVDVPLQVLSAVDLVAVVQAPGRLLELYEICLVEEGYRPNLLFGRGREPAPAALVPLAEPHLCATLRDHGHTSLAAELQAAAHGRAPPPAVPLEPADDPVQLAPPLRSLVGGRGAAGAPSAEHPAPYLLPPSPTLDDSSPGWELDQLDDAVLSDSPQSLTPPAEDHPGPLEPPPRPPSSGDG